MLKYLRQIWHTKDLRKKIIFTVGILVFYRFLAQITVPTANPAALAALQSNELLQGFSILTGGSAESFSIVLMGIGPYINASIIIQLLSVVVPKLENLKKEGESGRRKINSYTRWLTFPLAFLQSYGMIRLLNYGHSVPLIDETIQYGMITAMLTISAGTILLVWLGEQITEKGIGNGISLIIFANIIAQIPVILGQSLSLTSIDENKLIPLVTVILLSIILTTLVILVNEGHRKVPITYGTSSAKGKNNQTFLPIRINQVGMIPIIFAVAMVSMPTVLSQFLQNARSAGLQQFGENLAIWFDPNGIIYLAIYFLLVVGFTYFYVSITFKPEEIADNIQKRGGYIPGIRPGTETTEHIAYISSRLTFFGALFLATVAILPIVVNLLFNSSSSGSIPLLISGASIIIMVGVVLDLIRQINSQLVMHDYKKFY